MARVTPGPNAGHAAVGAGAVGSRQRTTANRCASDGGTPSMTAALSRRSLRRRIQRRMCGAGFAEAV